MQLEVVVTFYPVSGDKKERRRKQYGAVVEYDYDKDWKRSEEVIIDSLTTIGNKFIEEKYYGKPRGT